MLLFYLLHKTDSYVSKVVNIFTVVFFLKSYRTQNNDDNSDDYNDDDDDNN